MFTGIVEELGTVISREGSKLRIGASLVLEDAKLGRYVVEKGSITVDGISLTVVDVLEDGFTVAVIPHTAEVTTLGKKGPGDRVNLEVDVMAKYVERLLSGYVR